MFDFHQKAHTYIRDFVFGRDFPCIAGQSAVKTHHYALCAYSNMESDQVAEGVCHDLVRYMGKFSFDRPFNTFIAAFEKPDIETQLGGVESFYLLLRNMHTVDRKHFAFTADQGVSPDTMSPDFVYSVGGEGFFVPFFYAFSGSAARRSDINFVVFNANKAFEFLRRTGAFDKLKERIRANLPDVHPNLGDHGQAPQFPQYALVFQDSASQAGEQEIRKEILGECPFHPK